MTNEAKLRGQGTSPSGPTIAVMFVLATLAAPVAIGAQVVNPADAQEKGGETEEPQRESTRLRSWELPPVTIKGEPPAERREEERVGTYEQPRWTTKRRFPTTRVYVRPEGSVEFEWWLRPTFPDEGPVETRMLYELEFGLPHRFQLDLYFRTDQEGDHSEMLIGQQVELRYALADWGVLPGNPTLYLEWVGLEQRPDKVEPKLLFGGEIAPRFHWGVNLAAELELGGERENEYSVTGGLSYSVLDSVLGLGVESIVGASDVKGDRGHFGQSEFVYLGPSAQWHPMPQVTFNVAPLIGLTDDSPQAQVYFNFGYEF